MEEEQYRYLLDCAGSPKWFTVKSCKKEFDSVKGWAAFYILDGDEWKLGAIPENRVIIWHEI